MIKKRKVLVIDGSHLGHRANYRFKGYITDAGLKSGLAFGVPFMLESLVRRFRAHEVHIAFDNGRSPYRLELLPNYKNRAKKLDFDYESFKRQLADTINLLQNMGCHVYYGGEADDTLYRIIRKKRKKKEFITLVSGDKDFVQMLEPSYPHKYVLKIFNPNKDAIVTPSNARELYGYSAGECLSYLALDGDKSDKIPGLRGWGKVTIRKFLDEYGTVPEFLENHKEHKDFDKVKEIWGLNKQLIGLDEYYHAYGKDEPLYKQNGVLVYDHEVVKAFAKKYQLTGLLKPQVRLSMEGLLDE